MTAYDRSFAALLLVEAVSEVALDAARDLVRTRLADAEPLERSRQLFALSA